MILPYILESNPHPFYSFRGLKNQMWIRIACGLDSRSRAGFWKNDGAAVRAVRTIQYNNLLFYCIFLTARTAAPTFFQNPALDRKSNPHAILIHI